MAEGDTVFGLSQNTFLALVIVLVLILVGFLSFAITTGVKADRGLSGGLGMGFHLGSRNKEGYGKTTHPHLLEQDNVLVGGRERMTVFRSPGHGQLRARDVGRLQEVSAPGISATTYFTPPNARPY